MNGNSMNGMNGNMSQGAMFEAIRQVSFVMDELRLFLDTHPKDRRALEMFLSNQEMRRGLIAGLYREIRSDRLIFHKYGRHVELGKSADAVESGGKLICGATKRDCNFPLR